VCASSTLRPIFSLKSGRQIGTAREEVEKVHGKPERQELYARGQGPGIKGSSRLTRIL